MASRTLVSLSFGYPHQDRKIPEKNEFQEKNIPFIINQGLFLDILKKTQTQKNTKLKPNPEKTQGKSPKNSKSANSTEEQLLECKKKCLPTLVVKKMNK